jgi:hypothetical protein
MEPMQPSIVIPSAERFFTAARAGVSAMHKAVNRHYPGQRPQVEAAIAAFIIVGMMKMLDQEQR